MNRSEAKPQGNVPISLEHQVTLDKSNIHFTPNANLHLEIRNFSRKKLSSTGHTLLRFDRSAKNLTSLDASVSCTISLTRKPQPAIDNHEDVPESGTPTTRLSNTFIEPLEEAPDLEGDPNNLTIHTSYEITKKLFFKSTIDWNNIAKAHRTPEIETIISFLDHIEEYPPTFHNQDPESSSSSPSKSDTFQNFYSALGKKFPNYDFETIQRAIDILALEQGRKTKAADPSFIILYSFLAQIWHSGLTIRNAWMKFQTACFMISFDNFSILMRQAEVFKAQNTEETKLLLTELLCTTAEKSPLQETETDIPSSLLAEIFAPILPHIYFNAYNWSQALSLFNSQFGTELNVKKFKKFILPIIARKAKPHDERHTARIRRTLKKKVEVEITLETFCGAFNEATGWRFEEVVLRDAQNWLLGGW